MTTSLEVIAFLYQLILTPDDDRTREESLAIIGCLGKLISFKKKGIEIADVKKIKLDQSIDTASLGICYWFYALWEEEIDTVLEYIERKYY